MMGAVGTQGFVLISSVFAARILGKEVFGQFCFLQGTVVTVAALAGCGLGLTATRYVAAYRREDLRRAGSFIHFVMTISSTMTALASILLVVFAPYLAVRVFHLPQLTSSIRWAALYLFCVTVNGVQTGILAGFESFRAAASVNITRGISTLLLTLPLTWCCGLQGAVLAMGLAGALAYGMSLYQVKSVTKAHEIPKVRSLDWRHADVLWRFALPAVLSGILVSLVTWLSSLCLSRQPNGYAELGLFGAANQWRSAVTFLPAVLSQPLLPLLTSVTTVQKTSFNRLVSFSALLNGTVASAVGAAVVLGTPLVLIFYGKSYNGLNGVMIPLMLSGAITCAASPLGIALASRERSWTGFTLNLTWASGLLVVAYKCIPLYGAKGLAYAFLLASFLHMLCSAIVYKTVYCSFK